MICSVICLRLGSADESCQCKRIHLPINLCVGEREFILNGTISRQPSFFSLLFMHTHFPIVQKGRPNFRIKSSQESIIILLPFEFMSRFSNVDIQKQFMFIAKKKSFFVYFFPVCHKSFPSRGVINSGIRVN